VSELVRHHHMRRREAPLRGSGSTNETCPRCSLQPARPAPQHVSTLRADRASM